MEMISRDETLKVLEEAKNWILKSGKLEAFGMVVNLLDRVTALEVKEVKDGAE